MPTRRSVLAARLGVLPGMVLSQAQAQQRGRMINVATIGEPPTLDPMVSTADLVGIITQHILETFYTFNAKCDLTPLLAAALPRLSVGGTAYDIPLRRACVSRTAA
jgi:peptide/nickel transport system substrate-binding protein